MVAPFLMVNKLSSGSVSYEVHQENSSEHILSLVNSIITAHKYSSFNSSWLLIATWKSIQKPGTNLVSVTTKHLKNNILANLKYIFTDQHIPGNTGHRFHLIILHLHIFLWGLKFFKSRQNWDFPHSRHSECYTWSYIQGASSFYSLFE